MPKPTITDADAILAGVARSRQFRSSPVMLRLLRFFVEEGLRRPDERFPVQEVAAAIQGDTQAAPDSSIVRVQVSRLRGVLSDYYEENGDHDPWRIVLPKGSYTVQLHQHHVPGTALARPRMRLRFPRLAVMPCWHFGVEEKYQGFCLGLTHELLLVAFSSTITELISLDLNPEIQLNDEQSYADQLVGKVDFTLHTTLQVEDDCLRITAKVRDVREKNYIGTIKLDAPLSAESLLTVQDRMAMQIAAQVANPGGIIDRYLRQGRGHRVATPAVLPYFQYQDSLTAESHLMARTVLQQLVIDDPGYAQAWACLANVYVGEFIFRFNPRERDPLQSALIAARKALQLDPVSLDGLCALAFAHYCRGEYDLFGDVLDIFRRRKTNRADLLAKMGALAAYTGMWEEGLAMVDQAVVFNPAYPGWFLLPQVIWLFRAGLYDEALRKLSAINMEDFFWVPLLRAMIMARMGKKALAAEAVVQLFKVCPDFRKRGAAMLKTYFPEPTLYKLAVKALGQAGFKLVK